jgi:hypothetical protein
MEVLELNTERSGRLPASSFPEAAEVYFCDKCGRDLTKHLHRGHRHSGCPLGPPRHKCDCGESYLTGAVEWDHLGNGGRRRRIQFLRLGFVLSLPLILSGTAIYWGFAREYYLLAIVASISLILTVPLFVVFAISLFEVIQIACSIWRTRMARPARADRVQR